MPASRAGPPKPRAVWIAVFPDFLLLDATGPAQVFATANDAAEDAGLPPRYVIHVGAVGGGLVRSSAGIALATAPLPAARALHGATALVVGGRGVTRAARDRRLVSWLARLPRTAHRHGAVCTGSLLLAAAGVLRGRRATTHWMDIAALRAADPAIDVLEDPIFVKDGNLYTSAGITAGIDLSLALVEEDHGRDVALAVAKRLVVDHKRPGGQRQFSAALLAQASGSALVEGLTDWLRARLARRIGIEDMASALALSPRTLHRRLRAEGGLAPGELLLRLRLEEACRCVEQGALSFKQIAVRTGFGTEYNLRRAFRQRLGVTPGSYRARFG